MALKSLEITQFRNLTAISLKPHPQFNIFYGENGSGKTSLLEAIYVLSLGRSFRTRISSKFIQHETKQMIVFGQLQSPYATTIPIGIEKNRTTTKNKIKIDQEEVASAAALAELFPVQVVCPDSYKLLDAGPRYRRQFLDWGLFYVEHRFIKEWQRLKRTLLQRNSALKAQWDLEQIQAWEPELVEASVAIEQMRRDYFAKFVPIFNAVLSQLNPTLDITLIYKQGWNEAETLANILKKSFKRDRELGFTQYGPHRSDLQILITKNDVNRPVHEVLSRGQQKSVIYALRLAQGLLLQQTTGKTCTFLLDDLTSELDNGLITRVITILKEMKCQIFLTGVRLEGACELLTKEDYALFHVERGTLTPMFLDATDKPQDVENERMQEGEVEYG